jgi:hypothetical protein
MPRSLVSQAGRLVTRRQISFFAIEAHAGAKAHAFMMRRSKNSPEVASLSKRFLQIVIICRLIHTSWTRMEIFGLCLPDMKIM